MLYKMESNYNSPDITQDIQLEQSNISYDKAQDSNGLIFSLIFIYLAKIS